jgi:hypothetical protein
VPPHRVLRSRQSCLGKRAQKSRKTQIPSEFGRPARGGLRRNAVSSKNDSSSFPANSVWSSRIQRRFSINHTDSSASILPNLDLGEAILNGPGETTMSTSSPTPNPSEWVPSDTGSPRHEIQCLDWGRITALFDSASVQTAFGDWIDTDLSEMETRLAAFQSRGSFQRGWKESH